MELDEVTSDIANALVSIDSSRTPYRSFQPGVGPYGEPQLVKKVAIYLNSLPRYQGRVVTKRTPDLLIPGEWAIEFKIARPFGDNANEAENWSVNLLHPYPGNVSSVGDCLKLLELIGSERKSVVVIGYEHDPAKIDLGPLVNSFEAIATSVQHIRLGTRIEKTRKGLIHPVHRVARVFAWEVISKRH